ncbi:MAG: 3-keto-5-aminohexanoate cleavage protein [Lapillicoccus sp.]
MLKVCLNGSRPAHERVPVTATDLAVEAAAAVAAGADAIHVHPRTDDGVETLDIGVILAALAAIRTAAPGTAVGVSTHDLIVLDPADRLSAIRGWVGPREGGPDFASVNWHEVGAPEIAGTLHARGIGIEAGIFTPTSASNFIRTYWPEQVLRVLVEAMPGVSPGATGVWAAERILTVLGRTSAPVLVHGEGTWAWPVLRWAQAHGFDTRIGLEDTLVDEHGLRTFHNAALVAAATRRLPEARR